MNRGDRLVRGNSRFVSNTAFLGVSTVATTVLTLIQVKILAAYLPPETFGLFAALRGLSWLVALLAVNGFPQLLIRFLPHHESKKQLTSALVLSGVCFLAPMLLLSVFVFAIESHRSVFFDMVPADLLDTGVVFWFYLTTLAISIKIVLFGGLNGLRRLGAQTVLELLSLGIQVTWIFLWRRHLDLDGLFLILAVASLASCLAGVPWYLRRVAKDTRPADHRQPADSSGVVPAANYHRYWIGATGLSLVAMAFTDVDRYVLAKVLTLEVLSLFHIGSRIVRMANKFMSVPVLAFQPEVTRLDAEGRSSAIETSTRVFLKFNLALSVFVVFGLVTAAGEIIRLVASARYDGAVPLLMILAVSIPLSATTAPLTAVMKASNQVRHAFFCDLGWATAYVVLLLALGRYFGLVGAGLAHLSASVLQMILAVSLSRLRVGASFLANVFVRVVACGLVSFGPLLLTHVLFSSLPFGGVLTVVLMVVALVIFRSMVRWLAVFTAEEKRVLKEMFAKRGFGFIGERLF